MSGNILPIGPTPPSSESDSQSGLPAVRRSSRAPAPVWSGTPPAASSGMSAPQRYLSVLSRFKWLILLVTLLGATLGFIVSRFIDPMYEVEATIWIDNASPMASAAGGPAASSELLSAQAWQQLLTSGRVQEEVVRQLALYLQTEVPGDSVLFRGFELASAFAPGDYELAVGSDGRSYRLIWGEQAVRDQGVVGDSIGRTVGFLWRPDPSLLTAGRSVNFTVVPPREAAAGLTSRMSPSLINNFLTLQLTGTDPRFAATTLNTWINQFVLVANELKRLKLVYYANVQKEQLLNQERAVSDAEVAYQQFKVQTITEPSEGTAVAAGVLETSPTVLSSYFAQRQTLSDLETGRRTLQRLVSAASGGNISPEDVIGLNAMASTVPAAVPIQLALQEYFKLEADLRAQRQVFTEEAPVILDLQSRLNNLRRVTIPTQARAVLAALQQQERDLNQRLGNAESELREIPRRSLEEQRLLRAVQVSDGIYRQLQQEAAVADLAALSATPDVSILDSAVAPLRPSANTTPQILLVAVLGSLALAIVIAVLVDRVDSRFRYPDQAKNDLGLDILGAVPSLKSARKGRQDPEEAAQVVEAFRLVRLNIRHAIDGANPLMLTVSSPQASDGKSLVAANLALSFAEAGYRTLLVDGDIRRGSLHTAFDVPQKPGLADYLLGDSQRKDVLCSTSHPNLTVVPCGRRSRQGPELLASAQMTSMLASLRSAYEVIIVDSPPLSAGIDPYALGTATEHMLIVLRAGRTNLKLAHAKLAVLDRLPVHLVGTVLNGIQAKGIYEYYSYDYGYAADDDESHVPRLSETVEAGKQ